MTTKKAPPVVEETPVEDTEHVHLFQLTRKVLLAGVGAVALAQDEIEDFIERLIARGEIAEKDGRRLVHEVMDRRKKEIGQAETETSKRVHDILDKMNVPTKRDLDALVEKIAELSAKVDRLSK